MRLTRVSIEHFRAIARLELPLDSQLTVLVGNNASGKTSVLEAVVLGLGAVLTRMPRLRGVGFRRADLQRLPAPVARSLWPGVAPEAPGGIQAPYGRVTLTTDGGVSWDRTTRRDRAAHPLPQRLGWRALDEIVSPLVEAVQLGKPAELPVFAYYGTDRAVPLVPQRRRNFRKELDRFEALQGGLEAGFRFKEIFAWFMAQEDMERRERERQKDWEYHLSVLDGVRRAIERPLPGCRSPRTELHPLRLAVDYQAADNGTIEAFTSALREYVALVEAGQGEIEKERKLRSRLDELSPDDPALVRADLEIRRQRVLRRREASR